MDRDAQEAKKMTKDLPFKKKLANFWYYKKWWVITIAAAIVVMAITIYEIATMPQYDLTVGYYSELGISETNLEKLKDVIAQYTQDVNEDGRITISITPMQAGFEDGTDEAAVAETRLMSELTAGDTMLFICDKAYRDYLMSGNNAECFKDEFDMSENPELKQILNYEEDTLYVLLKDLYERDEDDADKRIEHNNAAIVLEGLRGEVNSAVNDSANK